MTLRERAPAILGVLHQHYSHAQCALHFKTPFQLLVATLLSAQTTDERVNLVTPSLFADFGDPDRMSRASLLQLEAKIKSVNYFKTKAKHLQQMALLLVERHQSQVPPNLEDLIALPGVGRKTAHVVLGNAFGLASGVVVDTHVGRLARRMGLTRQQDPEKVNQDLQKRIPQSHWISFSHQMIAHGRQICLARQPRCSECVFQSLCLRRI